MRTRAFQIGLLSCLMVLFAAHETVAQEKEDLRPNDAAMEGVAVHGDWKITVVRDGEVIKKLEFQNALTSSGRDHLPTLLTGLSTTSGKYRVSLVDLDSSTLECFQDKTSTAGVCIDDDQSVRALNLVTGARVELNLSFTVSVAGTISRVETAVEDCSGSTSPESCDSGTFESYSATDLGTSESVQQGDTVEVDVVFTFS